METMKLFHVEDQWTYSSALVRATTKERALELARAYACEELDDDDLEDFDDDNGRVSVCEVVDSGAEGVVVHFSADRS